MRLRASLQRALQRLRHRRQVGPRPPGPMATCRDRLASGVPLGVRWYARVTCATWLVRRPVNLYRLPWAVN